MTSPGFTFDWYRRVTSDMHWRTLLKHLLGASSKINYGEITGNGFELGMDYNHRFATGLGLNVKASISHIRRKDNKVQRNQQQYIWQL